MRLQPDNPTHYFNLGRACRQQDLLYPALRCFEASSRLQSPSEALKIAHQEALETRKSRLQELSRLWPQLLARGEDAKLLACCNRILALNPDQGGILLWKAGYLEKTGDPLAAYAVLHRLSKQDSDASVLAKARLEQLEPRVGARFRALENVAHGAALLKAGHLEEALQKAEVAHQHAPALAAPLELKGAILEAQNNERGARSAYREAQKLAPDPRAARMGLRRIERKDLARRRKVVGDLLLKSKTLRGAQKWDEADKILDQAEDFLRDDPLLSVLRGWLCLDRKQSEAAVMEMKKAAALDEEFPPAQKGLRIARLCFDRQMHQEMEAMVEKSRTHLQQKQWEAALGEAQRAGEKSLRRRHCAAAKPSPLPEKQLRGLMELELAVCEVSCCSYQNLEKPAEAVAGSHALVKLHRGGPAVALWRAAREHQTRQVKRYIELSAQQRRSKEFQPSLQSAERAITADPNAWPAFLHLGLSLECLREFDHAVKAYERAAQLRPDAAVVQQRLAGARERAAKVARARRNANIKTDVAVAGLALTAFKIAGILSDGDSDGDREA